jgi:Tol biopolymer transport system component
MNLKAGTKLGPYEIVAPLGAGGMGEVYRARDARLDRSVAIKILPSSVANDPERLRRFEQEARATGALNHPNILAIYDIGTHDSAPYIVSELLEGQTLRDRLNDSALPVRKAIEYGVQIARGLAGAHEKGIVHRDLKPENLFITNAGQIKILDFGLAKLIEPAGSASDIQTAGGTDPGIVLGTVGYMSPEQVRGKLVDQRSDIFNFGAILYEMISGVRAFHADSGVEILNAILKEDPPDLAGRAAHVSPALSRLIRRCLEKNPDERFRSAHDIAFALDALSESSISAGVGVLPEAKHGASRSVMAAIVALILIGAAFLIGRRTAPESTAFTSPTFKRLAFGRGVVRSARFDKDGKTILYAAEWNGEPLRVFLTRPESPESTPLPLADADILSISSAGELAVSLGRKFDFWYGTGILARAPLVGGSSRQILEGVSDADWSPDAKELAVVHRVNGRDRLEYPIGKTLLETDGYFSHIRVSPKGDRIAFLDHPFFGDNQGTAAVVDLQGKKQTLSEEMAAIGGLAWNSRTSEVWFAGTRAGERIALRASSMSGKSRMILQVPLDMTLQDVLPDGRVLLTGDKVTFESFGGSSTQPKERDLGVLGLTSASDISADGQFVLLTEQEVGGSNYDVYLRKTDGSLPVRIGEGIARSLSPDGRFVVATTYMPPSISILPTGAGEAKRFTPDLFEYLGAQFLTNDRIVVVGNPAGHLPRAYVMELKDGSIKPITPEFVPSRADRVVSVLGSPDGSRIIFREGGNLAQYSVSGERIGNVPGVAEDDLLMRWASDGNSIFVGSTKGHGFRIFRLDLATGRRELWREITPSDPAGIFASLSAVITPDGKAYAYNVPRFMSDLYLVEGLK